MGNAYYSSGERDEETGEYIRPKVWDDKIVHNNENAPAQPVEPKAFDSKTKSYIPKEFDNGYYIDHKEKYYKHATQYWDWEYFRRYANAVYDAYKNMAEYFFTNLKPIEPNDIPYFVNLAETPHQDININNLIAAENQLVKQFSRSNRTIQAKINKHSALSRLQMYDAKTWVMFFALTDKIPVKDNISLKKNYSNMDKNNIEHVMKVFRSAKLLNFHIKSNVSKAILGKYKGIANEVYNILKFSAVYDDVVKSVDGVTIEECSAIGNELTPKLAIAAETNDRIKSLFKFYNLYSNIKHVIQKTNTKTYMWKNGSSEWFIYSGDEKEDIGKDYYQECKRYFSACEKLKAKLSEDDTPFYKDVDKIYHELHEAILNATDSYNASHLAKYHESN